MFELIIVAIIVVWIIKKKNGVLKGSDSNRTMPNTTTTTAKPGSGNNNSGNAYKGIHTSYSSGNHNKPVRRSQTKSAVQEAKEDGNATTAYLMEKAEADAREHEREKYEEQKRLHEASGGLAVAERLLDGDPVPQNKKCVICGYCAAENLIPMIPRTRYSCYFCREPLN